MDGPAASQTEGCNARPDMRACFWLRTPALAKRKPFYSTCTEVISGEGHDTSESTTSILWNISLHFGAMESHVFSNFKCHPHASRATVIMRLPTRKHLSNNCLRTLLMTPSLALRRPPWVTNANPARAKKGNAEIVTECASGTPKRQNMLRKRNFFVNHFFLSF